MAFTSYKVEEISITLDRPCHEPMTFAFSSTQERIQTGSSSSFLSSKDEWQGKELDVRGGKAVHMLVHHRHANIDFVSFIFLHLFHTSF